MTFTVSPWWVWGVCSLALFGVVFWWRVARAAGRDLQLWWHGWRAGVTELPWQRFWAWLRRDRVTPLLEDDVWCKSCGAWHPPGPGCLDDDDLPPLPPERTWEQMTSHQLPIVDQRMGPAERAFWSEFDEFGPHGMLRPERERRAPWWEAEHRAAYEAMGLEFPSELMARVRELTP